MTEGILPHTTQAHPSEQDTISLVADSLGPSIYFPHPMWKCMAVCPYAWDINGSPRYSSKCINVEKDMGVTIEEVMEQTSDDDEAQTVSRGCGQSNLN